MLRGLIACALVACAPNTAFAGDRQVAAVKPDLRALPTHTAAISYGRSAPPFTLPLDIKRAETRPVVTLKLSGDTPVISRFTLTEAQAKPDWHVDTGLDDATASSGGTYAVSETMDDHRKPRFRRSALSTMLVLRLDGQDESPAFSVGGGGVGAALWHVAPR